MSKTTKLIAGLGIVGALGVAALPLGSISAASCPADPENPESPVPQCASAGLGVSLTDGLSISLENQAFTRNSSNGNITAISGDPTEFGTITGDAIIGGPVVYYNTGTKITAASSGTFDVSVIPGALTGVSDSSKSIPWSGTALSGSESSGYNIHYFNAANSATAAPLVTTGTTTTTTGEQGSETTAYATGTKILNGGGAEGGSSFVYTAYDIAAKTGLTSQDYLGTITYIVQAGA